VVGRWSWDQQTPKRRLAYIAEPDVIVIVVVVINISSSNNSSSSERKTAGKHFMQLRTKLILPVIKALV